MINLDIQIIQSKKARESAMPGRPMAQTIVQVMARELKRRMLAGKFVAEGAKWQGYSNRRPRRGFRTSPFYTARKAPKEWANGVQIWNSNKHFHSTTRPGSFNVSGGMWSGMSIYTNGINMARIRFMGRSQGYTLEWKTKKGSAIRRTINGKKVTIGRRKDRQVPRKRKIPNALKAWSIFDNTRVHVIEYSRSEMDALREFWDVWLMSTLDAVFNGQIEWRSDPNASTKIAKKLMREVKGGSTPFRQD